MKLLKLLLKGPLTFGYKTDLWILKRIYKLIKQQFGVSYHSSHVWKILIGLGWSCQKPEPKALQRNEREIENWKHYKWPIIKKAKDFNSSLIFLDESGFLLAPNVKRTWAPKGQTPNIYHMFSRDKISSIGALIISPKGKKINLCVRFRNRSLDGIDVKNFLKLLLKRFSGHLFLLWDRSPIHKRSEVQIFIEKHPRLHYEYFPAYAPELNPAEYIWNQADSALSNGKPENLLELKARLYNAMRRLQNSKELLWSCIYASDLNWKH